KIHIFGILTNIEIEGTLVKDSKAFVETLDKVIEGILVDDYELFVEMFDNAISENVLVDNSDVVVVILNEKTLVIESEEAS
ncbi:1338_t:CDS:1, partial [Racocetra persica]